MLVRCSAGLPGHGYDLPGGGWVGERLSGAKPTIDINIPSVPEITEIHVES